MKIKAKKSILKKENKMKKKCVKIKEKEIDSDEEVAQLDGEKSLNEESDDSNMSNLDEEDDGEIKTSKGGMKKHKLDLEKLKQTDPEFFKFLQKEDADLLELDEDDDEEDLDEEELENDDDDDDNIEDDEDNENDDSGKKIKKPKSKVDGSSGRMIVDSSVYSYLQQVLSLEDEKIRLNPSDVRMAVDVFVACVSRVGADIEAPKYVINEQSIFEAIVRLCFQAMPDVLKKLLKGKKEGEKTSFSKVTLKKYQNYVRTYLHAVIVFLNEVQTPVVIISTLKAITRLIDFYAHFKKTTKLLIKAITKVWSRKTLECRLPAFVCMNLLVKKYPEHFVPLYKNAYVVFVSNSKVVTNETWPLLQFMHRTFAELTLLHPNEAYKYAFAYIRQTAVHLRNAMISKGRKDLIFTIYNWQMMQCIYMWVRVIAKAHSVTGAEAIAELSYPLIQVICGIFRLCNAPTFLPLRLHCCQLLIQLQASCSNYIPILEMSCAILEELARELKSKPKPSKGVVKIPEIEFSLKISSQFSDLPQWKKAVCEYVFRTMMQASHLLASQAAFPDVVLPITHRISKILKDIKSNDYTHLFRGLQTKLKEHSKFVINVLAKKDVRLRDEMQVRAVRFELNNPDSPIKAYYRQWESVWKTKEKAAVAHNNNQKDVDEKPKKRKIQVEKFNDDSEKDMKPELPKQKRKRAKIGAASKRADATVPDKFTNLDKWSDDEN